MYSILIVDDDELVLNFLAGVLRAADCELECIQNVNDALNSCEKKKYDLTVAYQHLPKMLGIDLLKKIMKHHHGMRRILICAPGDRNNAVDALNKGTIHKFVTGPWNSDMFKKLVREQLQFLNETTGSSIAPNHQYIERSVQ